MRLFFFLLFILYFCDLILTIRWFFIIFIDFAQRCLKVDFDALRIAEFPGRLELYDVEVIVETVVHKTVAKSVDQIL